MRPRIVYRFFLHVLLVPVLVLSAGCSGNAEPQLGVWKDGVFQSAVINTYEITGKRDGAVTRVLAELTLKSGEKIRMELEISYDPKPVLLSARWAIDGSKAGSGEVFAESLRFLGGQGEGPSVGGRFRLDENGDPRFRVVLPSQLVDQPKWTAN
jgi:hypothetical protein